jgi:hypothetical protein
MGLFFTVLRKYMRLTMNPAQHVWSRGVDGSGLKTAKNFLLPVSAEMILNKHYEVGELRSVLPF